MPCIICCVKLTGLNTYGKAAGISHWIFRVLIELQLWDVTLDTTHREARTFF